MNCEYCGRFLNSETCAGCGSPNPHLHRGDPIRLREGIEHTDYVNMGNYCLTAAIPNQRIGHTTEFRGLFMETGYRSLFSGDFISPSNVLRNQGDE